MSERNYKIRLFLWCKTYKSDKIWGFVEFNDAPPEDDKKYVWLPSDPGSIYNFWGRRGKTYTFKRYQGRKGERELFNLAHMKRHPPRGKEPYEDVSVVDVEDVCPGFYEEFEKQLFVAKLSSKIKTDYEI